MAARGEPDEPYTLGTVGAAAAYFCAERLKRRRMPDVKGIAKHAGLHADIGEPPGHRLGFVPGMLGIPATGQVVALNPGAPPIRREQ